MLTDEQQLCDGAQLFGVMGDEFPSDFSFYVLVLSIREAGCS